MRTHRVGSRLASLTAVAVALVGTIVLTGPAEAVNDYPYGATNTVDRWGFYTRNCTSYVAWRVERNGVAFHNTMAGPNGVRGRWGNAHEWDDNARRIGYAVDNRPAAGAVAQWNAGEAGASGWGHVAYVERVNADGSVVVSEYNWSRAYGYSERTVRAPRYIHIRDLGPGTAPPSAGVQFRTTGDGLRVRSGPGTQYSVVRTMGAAGTTVTVYCQLRSSSSVNGSTIWDRIDGGWVSDYFLTTPRFNDFSPGIPRC